MPCRGSSACVGRRKISRINLKGTLLQTQQHERSMKGVNVRLSGRLIDALAEEANVQRRTMRSFIRHVIQNKLVAEGYVKTKHGTPDG